MNLHGIVSPYIGTVNPLRQVWLAISTGYVTGTDGSRTPSYRPPVLVQAQIQALSYSDIQHLDALNIQGERRAIYISGKIDGIVRPENKGGDMITFGDGTQWLVATVLEYWPDWVKVAATLQNVPYRAAAAGPMPLLTTRGKP